MTLSPVAGNLGQLGASRYLGAPSLMALDTPRAYLDTPG